MAEHAAMQRKRDDTASSAVLETYELLELIITHLPPSVINAVRRVAKPWDELVQKSRAIRRHWVAQPTHFHTPPNYYFRSQLEHTNAGINDKCGAFPIYADVRTLVVNPLFRGHEEDEEDEEDLDSDDEEDKQDDGFKLMIDLATSTREEQLERRRQFLTNPPCTTIALNFQCQTVSVLLRVREGIKIEDLLDIESAFAKGERRSGRRRTKRLASGRKVLIPLPVLGWLTIGWDARDNKTPERCW